MLRDFKQRATRLCSAGVQRPISNPQRETEDILYFHFGLVAYVGGD